MTELIPTINDIVKYGLQPNLDVADKEKLLEKNLVRFYSLYFDIEYKFDQIEYLEFDRNEYSDIRKNVTGNFPEFGLYKKILDAHDLNRLQDIVIVDAADDLTDIILDLLEIKWRIENNSLADGLWFFEFIFKSHTQQHIINLLGFLKTR